MDTINIEIPIDTINIGIPIGSQLTLNFLSARKSPKTENMKDAL